MESLQLHVRSPAVASLGQVPHPPGNALVAYCFCIGKSKDVFICKLLCDFQVGLSIFLCSSLLS